MDTSLETDRPSARCRLDTLECKVGLAVLDSRVPRHASSVSRRIRYGAAGVAHVGRELRGAPRRSRGARTGVRARCRGAPCSSITRGKHRRSAARAPAESNALPIPRPAPVLDLDACVPVGAWRPLSPSPGPDWPPASRPAGRGLRQESCRRSLPTMASSRNNQDLADLVRFVNPVVRGWTTYYGRFYRSKWKRVLRHLDRARVAWTCRKYRHLRRREGAAKRYTPHPTERALHSIQSIAPPTTSLESLSPRGAAKLDGNRLEGGHAGAAGGRVGQILHGPQAHVDPAAGPMDGAASEPPDFAGCSRAIPRARRRNEKEARSANFVRLARTGMNVSPPTSPRRSPGFAPPASWPG